MRITLKTLDGEDRQVPFKTPKQTSILNRQGAVARSSREIDRLSKAGEDYTAEFADAVQASIQWLADHSADPEVDTDWIDTQCHYNEIIRAHNTLLRSRQPDPETVGE